LTNPADLEKGDQRLQQVGFLDSEGPKFNILLCGRSNNKIVSKSRFSKVCFLKSAYLLTIKSIWGNSKTGKRGNKRSII
jgi:hypothetical protein